LLDRLEHRRRKERNRFEERFTAFSGAETRARVERLLQLVEEGTV